jgi:hypothetical protein
MSDIYHKQEKKYSSGYGGRTAVIVVKNSAKKFTVRKKRNMRKYCSESKTYICFRREICFVV